MDDGTVYEEYVEDAPFIGHKCVCSTPSFCMGCYVFIKNFFKVRLAYGDFLPMQVAYAIINPNPNPSHRNQIQLQYWKPNSFENVDVDTYIR